MGAHVVAIDGFFFPMGKSYFAIIQTHGYVQFMGWVGLFIIGVSLYFFPRISHVPIKEKNQNLILTFISTGLIIRYVAHNIVFYLNGDDAIHSTIWLIFIGTSLVLLGVIYYSILLGQSVGKTRASSALDKIKPIKGFLFLTLLGWVIYNTVQVVLTWEMVEEGSLFMNQLHNNWSIKVFINLVILPICFAVSVRTFPLYLRLPAIKWHVENLVAWYAAGAGLELYYIKGWWTDIGSLIRIIAVIVFILRLDILFRRKSPWTYFQKEPYKVDRLNKPRKGYPDFGEWGRFELLVRSSYFWLFIAMVLEFIQILTLIFHLPFVIYPDGFRHMIVLGFATQLIFGMAPRMIPGFMRKRKVAYQSAVVWTFWLVNLAVVTRTAPILFSGKYFTHFMGALYGFSGIFGMAAIIIFSINMWRTTSLDS